MRQSATNVTKREVTVKQVLLLTVLVGLCLSVLPGCATVYVNAPPGRDVRLMAENEPMQSKQTVRAWYLLWGLVPISDNSTAKRISDHSLTGIRVKEQYGFVDVLISVFLSWTSLHSRTVVIEGQR